MNIIYLALGSNVGNKKEHIDTAVELLREHVTGIITAKIYETEAMYYKNQDSFLNTVIRGKTKFNPKELLTFVKDIEKQAGRIDRFRYGPREVDIDILFYNDLVYRDEDLAIPHPLMQEREFVLRPFMDIDPDFIHPVLNISIRDLFEKLKENK